MKRIAAALTLLAFAATATAQNDPDLLVSDLFKLDPSHRSRVLDMETLSDGRLIVAYVEYVPSANDRVVVMSRDPQTLQWKLLLNSGGYTRRILELDLAVPTKLTGDPKLDRAYIGLHLAENVGARTSWGWSEWEWVALLSGPLDTPWPQNMGKLKYVVMPHVPDGQPVAPRSHFRPSVAVVPVNPGDFSSHRVEMVFKFPENPNLSGGSIYRVSSTDYGHTVGAPVKLAGPGQKGISGGNSQLVGDRFEHASALSDDQNAALVVAFGDMTEKVVHVVANRATEPKLVPLYSTPTGHNSDSAPMLAEHDGLVYMTCLTGDQHPVQGVRLVWYQGNSYDGSSWSELGTLHDRAATPAAIEIVEDIAYVAVRCFTDNVPGAAPVHAIVVPTNLFNPPVATVISQGIVEGIQPRVALAPEGSGQSFTVFGWSTIDWQGIYQLAGDSCWIDP